MTLGRVEGVRKGEESVGSDQANHLIQRQIYQIKRLKKALGCPFHGKNGGFKE
jgi:hypothetical protein